MKIANPFKLNNSIYYFSMSRQQTDSLKTVNDKSASCDKVDKCW